ncbi:MAG: hypothetical protein U0941_21150 [Planctomycetaceae bacterium]
MLQHNLRHHKLTSIFRRCLLTLLIIWTLGQFSSAVSAAVTFDEIISLLGDIERETKSISVTCEFKIVHKYFPGRPEREVKLNLVQHATVDSRGRVRVETDGDGFRDGDVVEMYHQKTLGAFDGETTRSMTGDKNFTHGYITSLATDTWMRFDPRLATTHYFSQPVSEILKEMGGTVVGTESWNGFDVIRLETIPIERGAKRKYVFFLSPQHNFAIVRRAAAIQFEGQEQWVEYTRIACSDYFEPYAGIWVPRSAVYESFDPTADTVAKGAESPLSWRWEIQLKDWAINPVFDASLFTLEFGPGIYVNDKVTGRNYQTAGIADSILDSQSKEALEFASGSGTVKLTRRTFVILVNLAVLLALAVIAVWSHRKSASRNATRN